MTPQEQQLIDNLVDRIRTTQVQDKDPQADQHIRQALAASPDALYVLVQTVLVQQYGLQQAQSQLDELKRQVQALQQQAASAAQPQKSSSGSFLSHIFGGDTSPSQPTSTSAPPPFQPVNNPPSGPGNYGGGYPPPPPAYPPQNYPSGGGLFGGGSGGFLQGAMQTAAGVAAGELAFQGMEDLFHGFGGGSQRGFGGGETVVNNYYDEDRSAGRDSNDRGNDRDFYNPTDDASRNDLSANAASDDTDFGSGNDNFADTSADTGNFDDGGSGDGSFDSGGFDGGGNDFGDNS